MTLPGAISSETGAIRTVWSGCSGAGWASPRRPAVAARAAAPVASRPRRVCRVMRDPLWVREGGPAKAACASGFFGRRMGRAAGEHLPGQLAQPLPGQGEPLPAEGRDAVEAANGAAVPLAAGDEVAALLHGLQHRVERARAEPVAVPGQF